MPSSGILSVGFMLCLGDDVPSDIRITNSGILPVIQKANCQLFKKPTVHIYCKLLPQSTVNKTYTVSYLKPDGEDNGRKHK